MADAMIQYDADKASILRFYAAGSSRSTFGRQTGNNYNTPERRNRLLQLITENLNKLKKLPFEKWDINGQVDYILFKRNLENEQYQLLQEEKLYVQVAPALPFADKLMELQKPRRRGLNVNGETVAKSLNDINKEIVTAIVKLKKEIVWNLHKPIWLPMLRLHYRHRLKIILIFTTITIRFLAGGCPKPIAKQTACSHCFQKL
jgi:hypothetical protein